LQAVDKWGTIDVLVNNAGNRFCLDPIPVLESNLKAETPFASRLPGLSETLLGSKDYDRKSDVIQFFFTAKRLSSVQVGPCVATASSSW
jgi:NAD(P)-dependent dehydrogenase (short-subunit alcohol dehydrogenase family)